MKEIRSCKNCVAPERHVGCHATCEKYIAEKRELDKINELLRRENIIKQTTIYSNGTYNRGKGSRHNKSK